MENVVGGAVASRAKKVVDELLNNKSVNLTGIREPLDDFNTEVFEEVESLMKKNNPELQYGCSHSDGRFWLV